MLPVVWWKGIFISDKGCQDKRVGGGDDGGVN